MDSIIYNKSTTTMTYLLTSIYYTIILRYNKFVVCALVVVLSLLLFCDIVNDGSSVYMSKKEESVPRYVRRRIIIIEVLVFGCIYNMCMRI